MELEYEPRMRCYIPMLKRCIGSSKMRITQDLEVHPSDLGLENPADQGARLLSPVIRPQIEANSGAPLRLLLVNKRLPGIPSCLSRSGYVMQSAASYVKKLRDIRTGDDIELLELSLMQDSMNVPGSRSLLDSYG